MRAIGGEELLKWEKMEGVSGCEEKILVLVRLRPLSEKETAANESADWECINDTTILYWNTLREGSTFRSAYTFALEIGFIRSQIVAAIPGTFFCAWNALRMHWLANNILCLALCIQGIEMLSLGSFKTGAILLLAKCVGVGLPALIVMVFISQFRAGKTLITWWHAD